MTNSLIALNDDKSTQVPGGPQFLNIDTWHWISSLASDASLSTGQAEALTYCTLRIAQYRLSHLQGGLPSQQHLTHSLHLLRTLITDLDRLHHSTTTRLSLDFRAGWDRLTGDLASVSDQLRDLSSSLKGETGEIVEGWRAEGREETQRLEMEVHRLEGRLAATMSRFRSEAENVKVRSMYSFAGTLFLQPSWLYFTCLVVIFSILIIAVTQRPSKNKRKDSEEFSVEPTLPPSPTLI